MEKQRHTGRRAAALILAMFVVSAVSLYAQAPAGLSLSGGVTSGFRFRTLVSPALENQIDLYAFDDVLVNGDTAALRGALDQGTYGANFGLSLNANNSADGMFTPVGVTVSEASFWAKFLDNKVGIKAGYFGDPDYFTPLGAWSLAGLAASDSIQLTAYPLEGLRIDVRTRNWPVGAAGSVLFNAEQFAKNIDFGVKYSNPTFMVFAAFDDNCTPADVWQADAFLYFGYTGIPGLTLSVESKFLDLFAERKDMAGDAVGITNKTSVQAAYQITGDLSARAWFYVGSAAISGPAIGFGEELLGAEGFTFAVNAEVGYRLNESLRITLTPVFQIENTKNADIFDISIRPRLEWNIAPFPYAATVFFYYKFEKYGKGGLLAKDFTGEESPIIHSIGAVFSWAF
jgi:hypothetical protein